MHVSMDPLPSALYLGSSRSRLQSRYMRADGYVNFPCTCALAWPWGPTCVLDAAPMEAKTSMLSVRASFESKHDIDHAVLITSQNFKTRRLSTPGCERCCQPVGHSSQCFGPRKGTRLRRQVLKLSPMVSVYALDPVRGSCLAPTASREASFFTNSPAIETRNTAKRRRSLCMKRRYFYGGLWYVCVVNSNICLPR